jgi:hypothetical protein
MMKSTFVRIMMPAIALCLLTSCGRLEEEDVTLKPEYNFTSFAGTIWKTKVELAVEDSRRYTGERQLYLIALSRFDPSGSNYCGEGRDKIKTILPAGTLVRIDRYMKDHGIGNVNQVWGTVMNGEYAQKSVVVDMQLFENNQWLWIGWPNLSTNWGMDPEMFQKTR